MSAMHVRLWSLACLLAVAAPTAHSTGCSVGTVGLNFGNYDVFSTLDNDITGMDAFQHDRMPSLGSMLMLSLLP
jgi:hypothetical protein